MKTKHDYICHFAVASMLFFFQNYYLLPNLIVTVLKLILPVSAVIVCTVRNRLKIMNPMVFLWFSNFMAVATASILYTVSLQNSLDTMLSLISAMLMLGAVSQYVTEERNLERVITYLIIGGVFYAFYILLRQGTSIFTIGLDPRYTDGFNMQFSYVVIPTMLYLIWRMVYSKKHRIFLGTILIIIYSMSLLVGGKKLFFIPMLFLSILLFVKNKRSFLKLLISMVIICTLVITLYNLVITNSILYNLLGKRIELFLNYFTNSGRIDGSTEARIGLLHESWSVFINKPVFGVGLGGFQDISSWNRYAHNNYLELLACLGIIGFCAFYWVYIHLFANLCKIKQDDNNIKYLLVALLLTSLVNDFGTVSYYRPHYLIFICLGLCFINAQRKKIANTMNQGQLICIQTNIGLQEQER